MKETSVRGDAERSGTFTTKVRKDTRRRGKEGKCPEPEIGKDLNYLLSWKERRDLNNCRESRLNRSEKKRKRGPWSGVLRNRPEDCTCFS